MCGITAVVGTAPVTEPLLDGLQTLEYRGYDSAGIAVLDGERLHVSKHTGDIAALEGGLSDRLDCTVGIGHTRWSTHGRPTDDNAHPHTDCPGSVAVAHNGIIDNYDRLRTELRTEGHAFTSETDTEVVPHLIERELSRGADPETAFRRAVDRLSGSFALVALITGTDAVFATRQDSPLVIGTGSDQWFLASDVPAFLDYTDDVVYLQDGDLAVVSPDGYEITGPDGTGRDRPVETVSWVPGDVERGGYDHFMRKEIDEQPTALAQSIRGRFDRDEGTTTLDAVDTEQFEDVEEVVLVGCGTSYHAAMYGTQLFRDRGVRASAVLAGEYDGPPPSVSDRLVIGVTQSGETADTLAALRQARREGATTLALTNVVGSTAARECDYCLPIRAGPEIGVAATKTFSSQVVTLVLLAQQFGDADRDQALLDALATLPEAVDRIITNTAAERIAQQYADSEAFFYVGRGVGYAVALEGALKIKEISYEHAEGFPASELKHGPLALVTRGTPVVAVLGGEDDRRTIKTVEEVRSREAPTIVVTPERTSDVERVAEHVLDVPETHPALAGVLANVQLQLLAYHVADILDRPIDKPRNLAKSVTVQ